MAKYRDRDIVDALLRENWTLKGPNRPVKVVGRLPKGARPLGEIDSSARMSGYMTLAKHLRKMTLREMEKELGLPDGELFFGAVVYSFKRLPSITEVTYELTLDHPGGLAHTSSSDPQYKPGNASIHQWCIQAPSTVPVDFSNTIELDRDERFPG